jgi:hypothetical protein
MRTTSTRDRGDHDQSEMVRSVNGGSELGVGSSRARFYWISGLAGTVGAFELVDLPQRLIGVRVGVAGVPESGIQGLVAYRLGQWASHRRRRQVS